VAYKRPRRRHSKYSMLTYVMIGIILYTLYINTSQSSAAGFPDVTRFIHNIIPVMLGLVILIAVISYVLKQISKKRERKKLRLSGIIISIK
jgi:nucleoside recognition membrane protein YjiH